MKSLKLLKVRQALDRYLIKQRCNIFLERALSSKEALRFKKGIEGAIYSQVNDYLKESTVDNIRNRLSKVTDEEIVYSIIAEDFVSLGSKYEGISEFLRFGANAGGQSQLDINGIRAFFDLRDPDYLSYLKDHEKWLIETVDDTTKKWLSRYMTEGFEQGVSTKDIISGIADKVGGIGFFSAEQRAELILDAETQWAMSQTELEFMRRNNIKKKYWQTMQDDRVVYEICGRNQEQGHIPVEEMFQSGAMAPPGHFRCRCKLLTSEEINLEDLGDRLWTGQEQKTYFPRNRDLNNNVVKPYISEKRYGNYLYPKDNTKFRDWIKNQLFKAKIDNESISLVDQADEVFIDTFDKSFIEKHVQYEVADEDKVSKFIKDMNNGSKFEGPILIEFSDEPGIYRVYDGNHRTAASINSNGNNISFMIMRFEK